MYRKFLALAIVLCSPAPLLAQTVTLNGPSAVVAADDFATRSFRDPWDMSERTDLGWHLNGIDPPLSNLTNPTFNSGVFSGRTSGTESNVFLLETSIIGSAPLGKIGTNFPIDASTYRVLAVHMYVSAQSQARLLWFRDSIYDGTTTYSGAFTVTPGWRMYFVSIPALGVAAGSVSWSGLIKSLQLTLLPPGGAATDWAIDWVRLVSQPAASSFCRQVTWGSFAGAVDLYLDPDNVTNGNESLLEDAAASNTGTGGCSAAGSGYNFPAAALPGGNYQVVARPAGSASAFTRPSGQYQVNAIPIVTLTAPSEEGSSDDFATTVLGNTWDMNSLSDVDLFFNVSGQAITTIPAETLAGSSLGNVQVLFAQNSPPTQSDPILALLWTRSRIDPVRYRILTMEFGLPNFARSIAAGSVARIVWRVAGSGDSVSDDIIINSRAGANVVHKFTVDMADRTALPLEPGSPMGWVPGNSSNPGIDIFRLDVHEFPQPVPFFVRRVKLASFERVPPATNYTIRWTASEPSATVTLYYDTDRNPASGLTLIGSAPASAGSLVWTAPNIGGNPAYYVYAVIDDGQGNSNAMYSRWPVIIGAAFAPGITSPTGFRIVR